MSKDDARKFAYALLDEILAWTVARRLQPKPRVPVPPPTSQDDPDLQQLNDELFGPPDDGRRRKTTVGRAPNGKLVQAHTNAPIDKSQTEPPNPLKPPTYANGDPVDEAELRHYDVFVEVMRTAPFNKEKLLGWVYSK